MTANRQGQQNLLMSCWNRTPYLSFFLFEHYELFFSSNIMSSFFLWTCENHRIMWLLTYNALPFCLFLISINCLTRHTIFVGVFSFSCTVSCHPSHILFPTCCTVSGLRVNWTLFVIFTILINVYLLFIHDAEGAKTTFFFTFYKCVVAYNIRTWECQASQKVANNESIWIHWADT